MSDGGGVISALSVTGCLMRVGLYLHCLLQGVSWRWGYHICTVCYRVSDGDGVIIMTALSVSRCLMGVS